MTLHLIKLCVGVSSVDELEGWVNDRAARGETKDHVTRMFPQRGAEILDGGSLYWVIKGFIMCRQPIAALEPIRGSDGIARCRIVFEPKIILVRPVPRRAFQGWRYLKVDDVPPDAPRLSGAAISETMRRDLAELGLL
jgi:hypothetical protein